MPQPKDVPEGWVIEEPATNPDQPSGSAGHWEDRGLGGKVWRPDAPPSGQRQDQTIVDVNHEQIQHRIADWASTLPEPWRKPAAMLVGAPAHIVGSLVEALSAPESVATMGASPAMAGLGKIASGGATVAQAASSVPEMAEAMGTRLVRKIGIDPAAMEQQIAKTDLATTRLRLQAAKARTRINQAKAAQAAGPEGAGTAPTASPAPSGSGARAPTAQTPSSTPPAAPAPAQTPVGATPGTAGAPVPLTQAVNAVQKLATASKTHVPAKDFQQLTALIKEGYDPGEVWETYKAHKAAEQLQQSLGTVTDAEMNAAVAKKAATAKAKSTKPRYGSSQGDYGRSEGGNPFR